MSKEIFAVLSCFENGGWYNREELARQVKLDEFKVAIIFEFLAEYGFIELDEKGIKGRLSPRYQTFLKQLKKKDPEIVDQDELQLEDEMDHEWVEGWKKHLEKSNKQIKEQE